MVSIESESYELPPLKFTESGLTPWSVFAVIAATGAVFGKHRVALRSV